DIRRVYDRYGDGEHNDQIAKLMASLYLTLRGTAVMYYGEEIGMENNDPRRPEDVKDSMGKLGWPNEKGRDGERTPMKLNDQPNAGFSSVEPWLPVDSRYTQYNVESEKKDPDSILNYYRPLLMLHHTNKALLDGNYIPLNQDDQDVLSYMRSYKGENVLIVLNMTGAQKKIMRGLRSKGISEKSKRLLSSLKAPADVDTSAISIEPFGAWIGEIK